MSWLSTKPPWTTVKWLNWGDPTTTLWIQAPSVTVVTGHASTPINATLYKHKQAIEVLDTTDEWEFLKRSSNPYELVFSQSQDERIPLSVSNVRPLSRSFFKMVEILYILDFFPRHKKSIQSAHVCEGPGGFIEALLYQAAKVSTTVDHAWAMTLKPTKANIPGWRRAYNFLRKSPMVHIEYGADETGDILVPANQSSFLEKNRSQCSIFTADGGFDFSEHYSTQEEEVFPLLVSSSLIGLQTMNKGGDFVLKLFDTELKCTTHLIAILAYCFDSWTLYKPALSRPCNAEKYFLGRGCRVVPPWILRALTDLRDLPRGSNHVESIFNVMPEHIVRDIDTLKKEYLDQQVAALEYAIDHKYEWNAKPETIWASITKESVSWCNHFNIPLKIGITEV
jgi:hypothetical protein